MNSLGSPPTYRDWATGLEDTTVAKFIANPVNRSHYWSYPAANEWSLDASGGHSLSLDNVIQFAEQQGEPLAIPETGAGNSNNGTDVQDDPAFPRWLSQQLTAAEANGERIEFVNIWDSNASGGNYEYSNVADEKPLEAAAWAKYFGGQPPMPITVTTVAAVTITDIAMAIPFDGLIITDPNPGQTETAVVTLSNTGNGALSDPNAAADGSTISNGSYIVSGTAGAVATALSGLVFTPTAHQVASGQTVSTTITAAISDTAEETTSVITTVAATAVASAAPTITGAVSNQAITEAQTFRALSGITVTDATSSAEEAATITLVGAGGVVSDASGSLAGAGLTHTASGTYTLTASSAAAMTTALDALVFTPALHQVAPGQTATTQIAVSIYNLVGVATNTTTSVVVTDLETAPSVTGPQRSRKLTRVCSFELTH